MTTWKPTQAECDLIKQAAVLESLPRATTGQIKLEPGIRYSLSSKTAPECFNIARVSDLSDWADTDLVDRIDWKHFRKGVPLSEAGVAIVDFYIHARSDAIAEKLDFLLGNVVVFYAEGKLTAIHGVGSTGKDYLPKLLAQQGAQA